MIDSHLALQFSAALAIGMLLGLERERTQAADTAFAGVRTFALISLLGATAGFLQTRLLLPWLALSLFLAMAVLVGVSHAIAGLKGKMGITTEVTALLAFVLGQLCVQGHLAIAGAIAVACALLLSLKDWLHRLAGRIEAADIEATLKFAIVTLIVLPLLPNQDYGPEPFNIINPYKIWLMVVLISGLNFVSYLLVKTLGNEHGLGVTGVLGGLVSSTAATVGFSERSRRDPGRVALIAMAIVLAWAVMFVRLTAIVWVMNPAMGRIVLWKLGMVTVLSGLIALLLYRRGHREETGTVEAGPNPFALGPAIKFGLLFGVIILAAKAAQVHFGQRGLYVAGVVAGLTDVDAIALYAVQLARETPDLTGVAARTVLLAAMSNTLGKTVIVLWAASRDVKRVLVPIGLGLTLAGVATAFADVLAGWVLRLVGG